MLPQAAASFTEGREAPGGASPQGAKRPKVLTPHIQIPTSCRGHVRALVKSHRAWPAFLIEKGLISAQARNADLIEFALRHLTLTAQIEQILQNYTAAAPAESAAVLMLANRVEKLLITYASKRKAIEDRRRRNTADAYAHKPVVKSIAEHNARNLTRKELQHVAKVSKTL